MISALLIESFHHFRYAQAEIHAGTPTQTFLLCAGSSCHAAARICGRGKVMYRHLLTCITCSRLESPLCGYNNLRFIRETRLIHRRQLLSFQDEFLVFHRPCKNFLNLSVCLAQLLVSSKTSTFSKLLICLSFLFLSVNFRSNAMKTAAESLPQPSTWHCLPYMPSSRKYSFTVCNSKIISISDTHDASSSNS